MTSLAGDHAGDAGLADQRGRALPRALGANRDRARVPAHDRELAVGRRAAGDEMNRGIELGLELRAVIERDERRRAVRVEPELAADDVKARAPAPAQRAARIGDG